MQQSKQEVQNYQEHEVDLRALFNSLVAGRFLIAGLTGFITILALIYSLTLSPNYQVTSSFTSAPSSSIANINRLTYLDETKNSIFTSFLTSVSSKKLQKNVFLENDFITVFNKKNDPIEDIDGFISNILRSIKINSPKLKANMALYEEPYSISFTGSDKEAISRYLDKLIEQANKENIMELSKLNKLKIDNRIEEISIERDLLLEQAKQDRLNQIERIKEEDLQKIRQINDQIDGSRYKAKVERLNQIETLSQAAELAKSLGVKDNNLNIFKDIKAVIAIDEYNNLPDWYLYGENALIQRVKLLENRKSDDPFIPELVTLNNQLNEVQSNNLLKSLEARQDDSPFIAEIINLDIEKIKLKSEHNLSGAKSINLISSSKIENISRSKRRIVLIAFIAGFTMSILLILTLDLFKPNEKEPLPK